MYCAGVLTFDGGFMDSSSSQTKCVTERCEYRVSSSRAQPQPLSSVLEVITGREGGGKRAAKGRDARQKSLLMPATGMPSLG